MRTLALLAVLAAAAGVFLFRQRDLLRMMHYGQWLYPE